jgi:hexosaminidase
LEPLDPSQEATFELLEGLLQELTGGGKGGREGGREGGLFPFEFFHLGGDEVDTRCWSETPRVVEWMEKQGENFTVHDAYKYFVDRASALALAAGRTPVQWVEVRFRGWEKSRFI